MKQIHIDNLNSRFILEACQQAGWRDHSKIIEGTLYEGWAIPVYNKAGEPYFERWKNAHQDAPKSAKSRWVSKPPKEDGNTYYLLPDTIDAIRDKRFVFIASGEPDTMTFRQAGYNNVTCWFGETAIPESLVEDLQKWGVQRVFIYPDKDDTGMTMAGKLIAMFRDSNISLQMYDLGEVHDINDLWVDFEANTDAFLNHLRDLPALEVGVEYIPQANLGRREYRQTDGVSWFDEYHQKIMDYIQVQPVKRNGRIDRFQCISPSHPDENPSARISYDRDAQYGHYVCSCGDHPWSEVGAWIGLGTWDDYKADKMREFNLRNAERPIRPTDAVSPQAIEDAKAGKNVKPDVLWQTREEHLTTEPIVSSALLDWGVDESRIPIDDIVRSDLDTIELLKRRLKGKYVNKGVRPFPFRAFHAEGGVFRTLQTGDLVGILGLSGFGKTSFQDALVDVIRQMGDDVLIISPEIPWQEQADRISSRWGGATVESLQLHDLYNAEMVEDLNYTGQFGVPLDQGAIETTIRRIDYVSEWTGRAYYINLFGADFRYIMATAQKTILALRQMGRRIRWVFLDYIQLMTSTTKHHDMMPKKRLEPMSYMQMLHAYRALAFATGTIPIVASQVRKSDTRGKIKHNEKLLSDSGHSINDTYFKGFLTMNPVFRDEEGKDRANYIEVDIVKNSRGQRGATIELEVIWERMLFKDHPADGRRANYDSEPPVQRDEFGVILDDNDTPF